VLGFAGVVALVREAGAAVTSLITYVVPVVALVLGVSLLGETLTIGAIVGLVFIAFGTWLATSTRQPRLDREPAPRRRVSLHQSSTGRTPALRSDVLSRTCGLINRPSRITKR
jgi:positive regulator of sigma E activity